MKKFNFRLWGVYVLGITFLSAIINLIFSIGNWAGAWSAKSIWMGLVIGTGLHLWDLKHPLKKIIITHTLARKMLV